MGTELKDILMGIEWRDVLTVFGFAVGIVGLIFTIRGNIKAKELGAKDELLKLKDAELQIVDTQLTKEKNTVRWREIHGAAHELGIKLCNENFIPDFILALSPRGAIIAFCLTQQLGRDNIPIISGINQWTDSNQTNSILLSDFESITNQYEDFSDGNRNSRFYIPKTIYSIEGIRNKLILMIEDVADSGKSLKSAKQRLLDNDFIEQNIKTMSLATSTKAKYQNEAPDFYWWATNAEELYLPWGQAWGEGISR